MDKVYTHRWRTGDCLVCEEGANFILPGTVVVYEKDTFAPFVQVLVPGYQRSALGHFGQDSFRRATADEVHAALRARPTGWFPGRPIPEEVSRG